MVNTRDSGVKILKAFLWKKIRKYFQNKKFLQKFRNRKKNFKKIRASSIFKKWYTKDYAIMNGLRIFPADPKTSRVSTGRLVSRTTQTTSSAMVEYPCRETKRGIVFDNERTYVSALIS